MTRKDRKSRKVENLGSKNIKFFIFISIILIFFFILFFIDFFKQEKLIDEFLEENKSKTEEIQVLKKEIEDLKEDLDRVNSDEFIEKNARERLGMIKKDELIIVDPEDNE